MPMVTDLPNAQAVRAVFFDAGFTLLAPHPSVVEIALAACAARGVPVERACLEAHLPNAEASLRHSAKANPYIWAEQRAIDAIWIAYFTEMLRPCLHGATTAEVEAVAHEVHQTFEHAASYALYPDVIPALEALRERRLTLGVISDWGVGLGLILRHHDLVQYFDFAVISAAVRHSKPDPELFQTALRRADAIPDYAVHVGDSYVLDVLGARAAGITPVLLDRAGRVDPAQVDCLVIRDLGGLLAALEMEERE
jgi:putative hydrolase of the HAD superfamily